MNYVYRFINDVNKIIYVGRTNNLHSRMSSHFGKNGHLPQECYESVARIDMKCVDEQTDIDHIEKQLIGYFQPQYNQIHKSNKRYFIPEQHLDGWEIFKNIRPVMIPEAAPIIDKETKPYQWSMIDNIFMFILISLSLMILYGVWDVITDFTNIF